MGYKGNLTPAEAEALGVPSSVSVVGPVSSKQLEKLKEAKNTASRAGKERRRAAGK